VSNPIEIIGGLRDVQDRIGEFVRDGPSTGLPGYVRDKYRERCNQFANLPAWARALGNGTAGTMDRICTPYWDDNGWDGPEVTPPPFNGGQCDGELYLVEIGWTNDGTGVRQKVSRVAFGPIGPASILVDGFTNRLQFGSRGARASQDCATAPPAVEPYAISTVSSTAGSRSAPGIDSISKCSGADNCGDPPTEFPTRPGPNPPPDPGPIGGPVPTDNPNDPTGPPLIPIPPYEDPIYGPTPIVGPTGPTGGTGEPGGGTPPPPPGDIGNPGGASDTGAGGEAEGEAPEGSILVGLKIDILASPPKARQFVEGIFRGAVYIYMGVTGNLDQDYGGAMLKTGQFFFAEKDNLTHWRINANNGYNHRVTPYYRELEE